MSKITAAHSSYLEEKFGSRVSFNRRERKLYGHDIAALPRLIKPLMGNTLPEGVVQPDSEQDLVDLVCWASENRIPLTPRGKATSGYGGVLPVKGGLVVDFHRMKQIIHIDPATMTATVQPGIVWQRLDRELEKKGLSLLLYPSSYPAATVGGWLAQGGAGIGSFESGWFRDNVTSARVVLPKGEVKVFTGRDLDLVSEAEGITGIISEITLRVQPLQETEVVAVGCRNPHDLQRLAQAVIDEDLPVWSMVFINPRMADLKNRAPASEHGGHASEKKVTLPESYIVTIAYRKKDHDAVISRLPGLVTRHGGEMLADYIADHEWETRFNIMLIKRLGPSLVPAEVVVPLSHMGDAITEIEKKVSQPVVKEGVIIRKGAKGEPEAVILGFIPGDERKFGYNFIFGLSLTIMKIAEKFGGRPYSIGIYFSGKASDVLGKERLARLKQYKKEVDPNGIMNPGKVTGGGRPGRLIGAAGVFEPFIRPLANRVITEVGERPKKPVRGIPADVAWYAYSCSQCGYCVDECAQFYGRGWESQSPRGKWYWLREYMQGREKWDQFMVDTILSCTTCEMCNTRCSVSLPVEPSWLKLRGNLIGESSKMTFPPFEMMAAAVRKEGDIWAGYRANRADWFPADLKEKHGPDHIAKNVYFAGCTASYVEHDIGMASARLLDAAGVDFTYLGEKENCCGTPMLVAGKWDIFADIVKKNIAAVKASGADTVITSCPACDMMWRQVYSTWAKKLGIEFDIKTKHYSEVVADKITAGQFAFPKNGHETIKVTWHDSCHMGRASGIYEPPRQLIQALPGVELVEMEHNREKALCCGSVLTLIKEPEVAADIGKVKLDEALDAGAQKLLALCPCCQFQLRVSADRKKIPMEVVDLARFAASRLGYDFPDPNPEVQRQWAVFEAMIVLMTPEGFAELMGTMWPEMIDAMPLRMGAMMRAMGKVPGALSLMKPMFPILFPRLLPMMMPKVMPVMLERVAERIRMPDYMLEQMPDLMPHMIGDVVPLVTQPMIDYLQGRYSKAKVA